MGFSPASGQHFGDLEAHCLPGDPRRGTSSRPAHREVPNLQLIRPRERQEPPPLRLQSRLRGFDLLARLATGRLLRLRHPVLSQRLRRLQRKAAC